MNISARDGAVPVGIAIPPAVAEQAAYWFVELREAAPDAALHAQWQAWLASDPAHARAWQHLQSMQSHWEALPADLARSALQSPAVGRRRTLQALGGLAAVGLTAALLERRQAFAGWQADYHTGVGEQRELQLEDGIRVMLNTDTAINVDLGPVRRLALLRGEILVSSPTDRHLIAVATPHGGVAARSRRFSLWHGPDGDVASVMDGQLQIRPDAHAAAVLTAERRQRYSSREIYPSEPLAPDAAAWAEGMLIAHGRKLGSFLAELSRYRNGWIQCDAAVAALQVSGSYPLADTGRILQTLATVLPVEVRYLTRLWTRVVPRRA